MSGASSQDYMVANDLVLLILKDKGSEVALRDGRFDDLRHLRRGLDHQADGLVHGAPKFVPGR